MNVINLAKDIINFEFSKDLYKNNLLITKDRNITDINNYIKICYIINDDQKESGRIVASNGSLWVAGENHF